MRQLDDIEIAGFTALLGGAGAETVTKLVGSAVVDVRQRIPTSGRCCSTTAAGSRRRRGNAALRRPGAVQRPIHVKDVRSARHTIPAGKPVFLMEAAANRDPRAFTDADTFRHQPRPHRGAEPRPRLRHPQLPGRCAGPPGNADRDGSTARLHATLRGRVGRLAEVHMQNVAGYHHVPVRVLR